MQEPPEQLALTALLPKQAARTSKGFVRTGFTGEFTREALPALRRGFADAP